MRARWRLDRHGGACEVRNSRPRYRCGQVQAACLSADYCCEVSLNFFPAGVPAGGGDPATVVGRIGGRGARTPNSSCGSEAGSRGSIRKSLKTQGILDVREHLPIELGGTGVSRISLIIIFYFIFCLADPQRYPSARAGFGRTVTDY